MAKEHHPDRSGDPERFKRINEAYEVLSNDDRRQQYDQMRRYGAAGPGGINFDGFGGAGGIDLEDIFGSFFGGGRPGGAPRPARGRNSTVEVDVPFTTAALGGQVSIRTVGDKRLEVNIPVGTANGSKLRLRSQGQEGRAGGPAGDLIVAIRVAPHPDFRRESNNIVSTVEVDWLDMVLGSALDVTTLHGQVELNIPEGVQTGSRLRITGYGIRAGGKKGDHFVVLKALLPDNPTKKERKLLEQLRDLRKNKGSS